VVQHAQTSACFKIGEKQQCLQKVMKFPGDGNAHWALQCQVRIGILDRKSFRKVFSFLLEPHGYSQVTYRKIERLNKSSLLTHESLICSLSSALFHWSEEVFCRQRTMCVLQWGTYLIQLFSPFRQHVKRTWRKEGLSC